MDWKGKEQLQNYVEKRIGEYALIPVERKEILRQLAGIIIGSKEREINLIFICTHNSRRSHMAHLWASLAANCFGVDRVACYSGGTEATSFNLMAVDTMKDSGFEITTKIPGANPVYLVHYPGTEKGERVFSKKYTDPPNPARNFLAVMTCSDADEACPIVTGAVSRLVITYEDPKEFDGTPGAKEGYAERCRQIAREMLFVFSLTG